MTNLKKESFQLSKNTIKNEKHIYDFIDKYLYNINYILLLKKLIVYF